MFTNYKFSQGFFFTLKLLITLIKYTKDCGFSLIIKTKAFQEIQIYLQRCYKYGFSLNQTIYVLVLFSQHPQPLLCTYFIKKLIRYSRQVNMRVFSGWVQGLRSRLVKRRTLSQYQPTADGEVDICYQGTEECVWYFQLQKHLFIAIMFAWPRVTTLRRRAQHFYSQGEHPALFSPGGSGCLSSPQVHHCKTSGNDVKSKVCDKTQSSA